jgi:WD40 repeat protein
MAKFCDAEQLLLKSANADRLRTSLQMLRQALEDIWSTDAPRIIRDYTDHGVLHIERLAGFAGQLLEANDGRPLNPEEMYLLIAGLYMHDIGMQCDVVKFPDIKAKATELGASFDVEFRANKASDYDLDEQQSIRKNHQYLSAAWIDYASRTGKTVLGVAAQTIPKELIDDLMDVSKHHTKLPIAACPSAFTFDPTGRKQLVAALLRFADELDIDSNRVSFETVSTFSIDPHNAIYWWLHERTRIVFTARNVIQITMRLHPTDLKEYGSFVHKAFITAFQSKNQPVITILGQSGLPIIISSDSKVIPDDRATPLPPEIVKALRSLEERKDPLITLAEEVRTWLQVIRYEVGEVRRSSDREIDMIAVLDQGSLKQRVWVRCIDGEITLSDVEVLDAKLDRKTPQGWLISDKRVSNGARHKTTQDDALRVFNLSDFLRQMVWKPYFEFLVALVEKDRIPELYVDLACYKQSMDEKGKELDRELYKSLDKYVDEWLKERGKMHISLLGEFGAGKTWFCRHYAYRQLNRYLEDPASERLPLLITLRAFAKAMTAQQLINDALLEQYKLPFLGSAFQLFQEMNRRGKLVLILDGFDEMARQVDYQTVVDNFWELASLVDEGSKVLLTSRTEYFRWARESEKILAGEEYGRRTIVLRPPKFDVLHLEQLDEGQIRTVIIKRLGRSEGEAVSRHLLGAPNLAEIARKPVLLELLLAALDEVRADVLSTPSLVYLYATNKLALRNITAQRTFTTTADKLYFLCELAWEMIRSGSLRLHYSSFPDRIKTYFGEKIKDQRELDTWDFDLRNQTVLHRDAAGYYEFAHKSLAEYFVAFKFAAEIACLATPFHQTYCEADGAICKLPIKEKVIEELAESVGAMSLKDERMRGIKSLLIDMLASDAAKNLWKLINNTKGKAFSSVKYVGGNAATLLRMLGESFIGVDLRNASMASADLFGADLSKADLREAYLRDSTFSGCLREADLRNADCVDIEIWEPEQISSLSWSPDGEWLAIAGSGGNVWLRNIKSEAARLIRGTGRVFDIKWNPDSSVLALGTETEGITIWEADTLHKITTLATDRGLGLCLSFSPDGKYLAGGAYSITAWRTHDFSVAGIFPAEMIYDLCYEPSGKEIAIAGPAPNHNTVTIHDAKKFRKLKQWSISEGRERAPDRQERAHVKEVKWLSDFRVVTRTERGVSIWRSGKILARLLSSVVCIDVDRARDLVYCGTERGIVLWNASDLTRQQLTGTELQVSSLALSPDGMQLASGCNDGTVRIWSLGSRKNNLAECIKVLEFNTDCSRVQISGMIGLDQSKTWRMQGKSYEGTLLQFLAARGALLDREQKSILEGLIKEKGNNPGTDIKRSKVDPRNPSARRK